MLLGREAELSRIDALLGAARAGTSGSLGLVGEPGIGKTALADEAVARAEGMTVLAASGAETESELAFSGLADLFRPVLACLDALPSPQADALAGALAVGPPASRDRFTICAATLSLLAAAADDGPLLAVADNFQWIDASSREALLFASRRLGEEGVALLVAARADPDGALAAAGVPVVRIGPLPERDAATLLAETAGELPEPARADLLARAGGNPLALVELGRGVGTEEAAGGEEVAGSPDHRIERPFMRRVMALPDDARRILLLVAAGEAETRVVLERAARSLGLDAFWLELLEERGILAPEGERLRFRHPLFRSWTYHAASVPEQRAAHQALADATGAREAGRRAWHLAVAAPGADEAAAAALVESAGEARHRAGHAEAARAFQRAARLTDDAAERARLLLAAADDFRHVGDIERALRALDEALRLSDDASLRAAVQHMRGRAEMWRGAGREAHDLLVHEAALVAESEPARAAVMLTDAVMVALTAGELAAAEAAGRAACEAAASAGGASRSLADVALATVRVLRGASAADPLAEVPQSFLDEPDVSLPAHQLILFAGATLVWTERYDRAGALLVRMVERARAASAPGELPLVLATLADLDYRTGHWTAAYAGASEAVRLAAETRQTSALPYALACVARVEAVLGREHEARAHAHRALEVAEEAGAGSTTLFARWALGLLELGLGHPEEAAAELAEAAREAEARGLAEPGVAWWPPDLVEACVRLGREADASAALAAFEEQAKATGRTWALAAAARCRGLVAPEEELDEAFGQALEHHRAVESPFELARTELAYGESLRRARRRTDSREHLRAALAAFEMLGAVPWAERARTELHATGETLRRAEAVPLHELTPQELQVALLVARGATNREVGASLFLSPKTVEAHLSRIYRKLNVRSRTELAGYLATEGAPAGAL